MGSRWKIFIATRLFLRNGTKVKSQQAHHEYLICAFVQRTTKSHVWFYFLFPTASISVASYTGPYSTLLPYWKQEAVIANVTVEPYAKSVKLAPKDLCMDMTDLQIVHWWHVGKVDYPGKDVTVFQICAAVCTRMPPYGWLPNSSAATSL